MHSVPPLAVLAALLPFTWAAPASAQATFRLTETAAGVEGNSDSSRPAISADGRHVAFYSDSSNLVPGDTNLVRDIFVHDTMTGAITRVSVSSSGAQANDKSSRASISADVRYVAYYSDATNLVPGDTNLARDAFVHDRDADGDGVFDEPGAVATVRVSVSTGGVQGNALSSRPKLSADGRFVAFMSDATNLVAGDTNLFRDAFLHDRDADGNGVLDEPGGILTVRVSVSTGGAQGNAESSIPRVSEDGRHVVFRSDATNLVAGDTNGQRDVFVRDVVLGTTTRISLSTSGGQGDRESSRPTISADGRFVAFYSGASNLVPGDTNQHCELDIFGQPICTNARDCFVRDRDTDEDGIYDEPGAVSTVRVSVTTSGAQGNDRTEDPDISADGRFVTFWTEATNFFGADANGSLADVLLHDRDADGNGVFDEPGGISTVLVSQSTAGVQSNDVSRRPVVSADGRYVAFRGNGTNLVAGDTNLSEDVFLRDVTGPSCTVTRFGASSPSCTGPLQIDLLGCMQAGQLATFTSTNAPPSTAGNLLVGFAPLPVGVPVLGVDVWVDIFGSTFVLLPASSDAAGLGSSLLVVPPSGEGVTVFFQHFFFNTAACGGFGTFSASDAISTTVL